MTMRTVTRADLCEVVYQKVGLSRSECAVLVELVLTEIMDCLERGETVKLSSFGSFAVRKKGQRIGHNPKTGIEVPISPRRVMVFKASEILKRAIRSRPANGDKYGRVRQEKSAISVIRESKTRNWQMKFGRNALCPCGSGKKYKHCCLKAAATPAVVSPDLTWQRLRALVECGEETDFVPVTNELFSDSRPPPPGRTS